MDTPMLGGLSRSAFLRRYWQRRPLCVRGALPELAGLMDERRIRAFAADAEVESRLVEKRRRSWQLTPGPISPARLRQAGATNWSLLVNGMNLLDQAADTLLRRFDFAPQARLDDVMASLAAPGGGVGPHYDSYDVFLLQAVGRRVWRLCRPRRYTPVHGSALRLIDGFVAEEEYLVEPGDLLYIPPDWGHDGVALEPSLAYSVGFRAPEAGEIAAVLLDRLHERDLPRRAYRDPARRPSASSARIPDAMIGFAVDALERVRWTPREVARVLGEHLTMPKQQVVYTPPARRPGPAAFARLLLRSVVVLDRKTQLLYHDTNFFINGDCCEPLRPAQRRALAMLANRRRLAGAALERAALAPLLREWHGLGYLHLEHP